MWADCFVWLHGKQNNEVSSHYKRALPRDKLELMPLDCSLFDHVKKACPRMWHFSFWQVPMKASTHREHLKWHSIPFKNCCKGLFQTKRIEEGMEKIPTTVDEITELKKSHISDRTVTQIGHKSMAEKEKQRQTVSLQVMKKFLGRFKDMTKGGRVTFKHTLQLLVLFEEVEVEKDDDGAVEVDLLTSNQVSTSNEAFLTTTEALA